MAGYTVTQGSHICLSAQRGPSVAVECHKLAHRVAIPTEGRHAFVELDRSRNTLSPMLHGGVGNVLFQLAALLRIGRQHNRSVLVGHFVHHNSRILQFGEWGGHPAPFRNAVWCDYVEEIECLAPFDNANEAVPFNDNCQFDVVAPSDYVNLPASYPDGAFFLGGYFFNYRYWHDYSRPPLRFTTRVTAYVDQMYGALFRHRTVVTIHLRLGYKDEPSLNNLHWRPMPPRSFWRRAVLAVEQMASGDRDLVFLLFSDASEPRCRKYLGTFLRHHETLFVEEDPLTSIHMMSLADYNIVTASTFSLWGAHLNQKRAPALIHKNTFAGHGNDLFAPDDTRWIVFS